MGPASKQKIEKKDSYLLKGYIRLHIAVLTAFPAFAEAQGVSRNYQDESYGGGASGSWKGLVIVCIVAGLGAWWLNKHEKELRQKQEEERVKASGRELEAANNQELKDFYRRKYEATKLVYAEPEYVKIFNKHPEARRNEHLAEIAGFVDELSDIDKFIERMEAIPFVERGPFREEAEARMGQRVELLKRVYRDLN